MGDYGKQALFDPATRALMQKITFTHGGPDYDARYPDGIPTSIEISTKDGKTHSSGMVMYPPGHARNTSADLKQLLFTKNKMLGSCVFTEPAALEKFLKPLNNIKSLAPADLQDIYLFDWSKMKQNACID